MSNPLQTSEQSINGHHPHHSTSQTAAQPSYFLTQRAHLVNEIAAALDSTLTHLNRLNRSLESVIGIGNEFSNVEALWSQFEGVMAQGNVGGNAGAGAGAGGGVGGKEEVGEGADERESGLETPPVARTGMGGR